MWIQVNDKEYLNLVCLNKHWYYRTKELNRRKVLILCFIRNSGECFLGQEMTKTQPLGD